MSLLAAFAFVGARVAAADVTPASYAIHQYVAGEDNAFADLQGKATDSDDSFAYYQSALKLPGASACAIYTVKANGDRFGTCDFDANALADAKTLFDTWIGNIRAAEPDWIVLKVDNPSHVEQVIITDAKRVHGVYVYVAKSDDGKSYRLTTTFGTMAAISR